MQRKDKTEDAHELFSCEQCGVTRKGKIKLKSHMQSHREISCKHCEKKIPYNSKSSHMRKCLGKKKLECEHCQALFQTKDSLIKHLTRKSCSIKCNFCDKNLKGKFYLKHGIISLCGNTSCGNHRRAFCNLTVNRVPKRLEVYCL